MNSTSDPGSTEDRCRRLQHQISTLKHVASLRRSLLELRGKQAKGLISKLKFYEVIVAGEREARHSLSNRLVSTEAQCGQLTERLSKNLQTIDDIKVNYENKASTLITEIQTSEQRNQQLSDQLNCAQLRITEVTKDNTMEELRTQLEEASKMLEEKDRLAKEMQKQMKRVWERNKMLTYQMSLLNNLFSETEGVTIDFEKIKTIGDIVRESQSYAEETEDVMSDEEFSERRPSVDLENLLDSMEKAEKNPAEDIPGEESCYKSVDTKRGPQLVLSVSKTFIKLKDLILEKKSLSKEIDTLKTLNTKLESKVDKQEHRLYRVTMELNKTWSLVSKLKQQHKKLYNSEAVLRYELQEKRALLEKLKNELSASREKWRRVKQKNSQSQVEWEKLRDEFAQRRNESSQESGTFSEVVSVSSSGENEVAASEEEENGQGGVRKTKNSGANDLENTETLPMSSTAAAIVSSDDNANTTETPTVSSDDNVNTPDCPDTPTEVPQPTPSEVPDDVHDAAPEEDESEGASSSAFSPTGDETSTEDPLEELVSQLVEDIDNEGDTEDENSSSAPRPPLETDSSPSPDFEDRMRRRADRLRMLEEQCHSLHQKLVASTNRGVALSTKLAELHDHYGPSGSSSTGVPNDQQQQGDGDHRQTSQIQDEVAPNAHSTNPTVTVTDEDAISTDAASASGPGNNSAQAQDCQATLQEQPEPDKQMEIGAGACLEGKEQIIESSSASTRDELISASENSSITVASSVEVENNIIPDEPLDKSQNETISQSQPSQGHPNDDAEVIIAVTKVDIDNSLLTTVKEASSHKGDPNTSLVCPDLVTATTVPDAAASASPAIKDELSLASVNSPESSSRDLERGSEDNGNAEPVSNCDGRMGMGNEDESASRHDRHDHPEGDRTDHVEEVLQASLTSEQISNSNVEILPEASQPQVSEEILAVEEPVPIIQETVVQHFPVTTEEEEANEFAPVQIRPEFLRILQEADEATNVSSLDWMPSLLTITHSVALLRLDHDSPSVARNNNNRSLSESLRIEIPRQSPSPPPATLHRREDNGGRSGTNHNDGHVSTDEEVETERASASATRKDPGFLSRMIIKQLPKRLQLLKNENHTLQMEAAESKMRMKEMKRQLTKEAEKTQQLANSLDSQIDDKNLVEFELREELETKEKVIEELQVEIDASKSYVDELKKEKDETEAFLKVFMDEKIDLERPKVSPDSVKNCNNCKRPFSLMSRRKVHCKICGQVFCKDCALEREPNKRSSKRPRLCTCCHLRRLRLVVLVNATKQSSAQST